jgi:plasmid stabilization system protein ParE
MKFRLEDRAEAEIWQAIEHYESCRPGLGEEFGLELEAAFQQILAHPLAWPKLDASLRRCQVRRFPYAVIYRVRPREIQILVVMHLHRRPGYWRS